MKQNIFEYLVFAGLVLIAAVIGTVATRSSVDTWFQTLQKPPLDPPRWVFGPVWTMIYIMIATAGYLVWNHRANNDVTVLLWVYGIQLVLNALWSVLFFGFQKPGWAFLEICFLWMSIVLFAVFAWPVSRSAALLFVPYALWVGFAGYLNFFLWYLN